MENAEKILHTFWADNNSIVLFWDREHDWQVLCAGDSLIDQKYYKEQGIFGLTGLIADKDRICFENYLKDVKGNMDGQDSEVITAKKNHETVFLFCISDCSVYYKVCRYMDYVEGKAESILFRIEQLEPEVRDHEPRLALDGREDGLYFYRALALECSKHLKTGGAVYFEIGYDQSAAVEKILSIAGFDEIETIKDEPGLDRVVKACWNR